MDLHDSSLTYWVNYKTLFSFLLFKNFALCGERDRAARRLICMHSANHFCFAGVHRSHELSSREANVRKSGQDDSQSTLSPCSEANEKTIRPFPSAVRLEGDATFCFGPECRRRLLNNFSINRHTRRHREDMCVTWACMEKAKSATGLKFRVWHKSRCCVFGIMSLGTRGSCCINLDEESLRVTQLSSKNLLRAAAETICRGSARDAHFSLKYIQILDKHIWQLDFASFLAATIFALLSTPHDRAESPCRLLMSLGALWALALRHTGIKANLTACGVLHVNY